MEVNDSSQRMEERVQGGWEEAKCLACPLW